MMDQMIPPFLDNGIIATEATTRKNIIKITNMLLSISISITKKTFSNIHSLPIETWIQSFIIQLLLPWFLLTQNGGEASLMSPTDQIHLPMRVINPHFLRKSITRKTFSNIHSLLIEIWIQLSIIQ